jgi:hypothetical protein
MLKKLLIVGVGLGVIGGSGFAVFPQRHDNVKPQGPVSRPVIQSTQKRGDAPFEPPFVVQRQLDVGRERMLPFSVSQTALEGPFQPVEGS